MTTQLVSAEGTPLDDVMSLMEPAEAAAFCRFAIDGTPTVPASISYYPVGDTLITHFTGPAHRVFRTAEAIARDGRDFVHVTVVRSGECVVRIDDRVSLVTADTLTFMRSHAEFTIAYSVPFESMSAQMRRSMLPRESQRLLRQVTGRPVSDSPLARATMALLASLGTATDAPSEAEAEELQRTLVSLMHALIVQEAAVRDGTPEVDLRRRALEYIRQNYSKHDLDPEHVAGQLGISMRQLSRAFVSQSTTVAKEIRDTRLARVADDLASGSATDLEQVAHAHGFAGAAQCGRAFKSRYGVTMRGFRALRDAGI